MKGICYPQSNRKKSDTTLVREWGRPDEAIPKPLISSIKQVSPEHDSKQKSVVEGLGNLGQYDSQRQPLIPRVEKGSATIFSATRSSHQPYTNSRFDQEVGNNADAFLHRLSYCMPF